MELKAGTEYVIRITPQKQMTTASYRSLHTSIRNCLLESETPANSSMKIYTKTNCQFECKIKNAAEKCQCLPWDFNFLTIDKDFSECDVFGRTCFYNIMNMKLNNSCLYCQDQCKFTNYLKKVISEIDIKKADPPYYTVPDRWSKQTPKNRKDFEQYILDENNTIEKFTWNEQINIKDSIKQKGYGAKLSKLIVVNVVFESPNVEMSILDTKYSTMDQLANLGGSIGVAEQITGASALAILHFFVLIAKSVFNLMWRYFKH